MSYHLLTFSGGLPVTSTPYTNFCDALQSFRALKVGPKQGRDRVRLFRTKGGPWHLIREKPRVPNKLPPAEKPGDISVKRDLLIEQPIPAWATR